MSRRIRRTPFTSKVEAHGVRGFSVVNHMLLPKAFQASVEDDYWHLREHVQLWDVSCQRQVEIAGPDAERLVQWMTPRDLSGAEQGQCLYVPLVDDKGGMINDPVLLKLAGDHFWLSIADSDVLLWARGLALGAGLNVSVEEPDVSPLAIQGPKAELVMAAVFGERVRDVKFFGFAHAKFCGERQVIARSGYSRQGGFEVYLNDAQLGPALWDALWQAGEPHGIRPGCPNLIERIEGGLLSYGNEMTRDNNPFECGLEKFCDLDGPADFLGKTALCRIRDKGHAREIRGIVFGGEACPPCGTPWPVMAGGSDGEQIGQITSAAYSPRLSQNIGLSMIERPHWQAGQKVTVHCADGTARPGVVSDLPFS
ncbi:MAG: dimethylsulfoniopropionate demethylase [Rhizobiales bacterium]|nr:dimethylsulfoniopropionate demethylase [Hyphomicrobiales bacterium]